MTPKREKELWARVEAMGSVCKASDTRELQCRVEDLAESFLDAAEVIRELRERKAMIPRIIFERTLKNFHCPAAMEMVLPRWNAANEIEVFLTRRESDDPSFKGEPYHTPGTYFWIGESDEETAQRLAMKELAPAELVSFQQVISINLRGDYGLRASTRSVVFYGEIGGEPKTGKWLRLADVLNGKVPIIESHREILQLGIVPLLQDPPHVR